MVCTLSPGRLGAALIVAACAFVAFAPGARAQTQEVSVDPSSGPPGSQFTITMKNYGACPAENPNCIEIDFLQGANKIKIATADSKGSSSFSGGPLTVPPSATAGSATVHAFGPTGDAATGFTVTSAPPATTTTVPGTTTSISTTTSSSTTTLTTIIPPLTEPSTTTTIATKKSSSHSDAPRYIAVALVVLAAAATAAVDTRMRHLQPPPGP